MARFLPIDRDSHYFFPPSVQDWLPETHLARYIANVIESLDLSEIERAYAGRGSDPYHPASLMSLLIYGYATGVFSSRRIELATYDSVAFRYLACNRHPDHDTLASFRRRFGEQFQALFVQVLQIAQANRLSQFGTVSLDGTKLHANASRHSALSYGHAEKLEAQLQQEVQELLVLAESADQSERPEGLSVPAEIARREDQLQAIRDAKAKIEARAKARHDKEQADFDAKLKVREEKAAKSGKPPTPPSSAPREEDQVNLTDDESRIMKVAGGSFDQCYNAQAVVDTETMLVMVPEVTQAANDKQQVEPMLAKLQALPSGLNAPATLLADTGYYSEANVAACKQAKIEPLIAVKREGHHPSWQERFAEPEPLAEDASDVERMEHALKTREGKQAYRLRKQTVEPVFGIIKSVMRFRQFMLRGLINVRHEWTLVCLAWNLKRMAVLRPQSVQWA
ncbi:MAG: IS1182 family transposase [Limnohabitans sp.]|nr:MAG: IS1182 family transposase [Limnohabitans sp.]